MKTTDKTDLAAYIDHYATISDARGAEQTARENAK